MKVQTDYELSRKGTSRLVERITLFPLLTLRDLQRRQIGRNEVSAGTLGLVVALSMLQS